VLWLEYGDLVVFGVENVEATTQARDFGRPGDQLPSRFNHALEKISKTTNGS
jgi:hypothetical protein